MGLIVKAATLVSRVARKKSTGGGIRKINPLKGLAQKDKDFLSTVFGGLGGFFNSLFATVVSGLFKGIAWTFTELWSLIVATVQFAINFNWNITDAEIDQQILSNFNRLGSVYGGFFGQAFGWLGCGALPGAVIMYFNQALGMYVLKEVGEEALGELASSLAQVVKATFNALVQSAVLFIYKNVRNLFRESELEMRNRLAEKGLKISEIQKAVDERNKPWVAAQKIENKIESIPNQFLQNFTEEFVDEIGESCIEAGYVVAGSLDRYFAEQKVGNPDTTVEIEFKDDGTTEINRV
jgi:hypothetical protein